MYSGGNFSPVTSLGKCAVAGTCRVDFNIRSIFVVLRKCNAIIAQSRMAYLLENSARCSALLIPARCARAARKMKCGTSFEVCGFG